MAILRNGNPVDYKMLCNDVEIERTTYKGEEVWANATPFYWIKDNEVQSGFLSNYATYTVSYENQGIIVLNVAKFGMSAPGENRTINAETEQINTQRNKYMEIIFNDQGVTDYTSHSGGVLNSFKVAGVEYREEVTENAIITIDVSNLDTVSISVVLTAWALGNYAEVNIKSIRFYS